MVAFEIKSMPGPFRKYDGDIDRDLARGIDAIGRSLTTPVQAASDVLREMESGTAQRPETSFMERPTRRLRATSSW